MNKKYYLICLAVIIIAFGAIFFYDLNAINKYSSVKPQDLLRFHVIANSNLSDDQKIKLQVRDKILEKYYSQLSSIENIEEVVIFLNNNINEFKRLTEQVLYQNGFSYPVMVSVEKDVFPTKKYYNFIAPAGEYMAFKIVLGEGKGNNWWCVLFPPLCLVDITKDSKGIPVLDEDIAIPTMGKVLKETNQNIADEELTKNKISEVLNYYKTKINKVMLAQ